MSDDASGQARPGAPALEKGLDVLELLAGTPGGLTQKQVADAIGRSVGEIFRMLAVLEQRGYVSRTRPGGEYTLSLRLFHLATQHPPTRRLQHAAGPVLQQLADATNLSCHLSVLSGRDFTVIAQTEPDWRMGWHVKLGARFPLSLRYPSARVLAAFQPEAQRQDMVGLIAAADGATPAAVHADLAAVRRGGGIFSTRRATLATTSFAAPVLEPDGDAIAALNLPLVQDAAHPMGEPALAAALRDAARQIAQRAGVG